MSHANTRKGKEPTTIKNREIRYPFKISPRKHNDRMAVRKAKQLQRMLNWYVTQDADGKKAFENIRHQAIEKCLKAVEKHVTWPDP